MEFDLCFGVVGIVNVLIWVDVIGNDFGYVWNCFGMLIEYLFEE